MIPIKNIYYMLTYAFKVLNENGYKSIETESFDNIAELCSAILVKGMNNQLKRGLARNYIPNTDTLSGVKGKIDISSSIKKQTLINKQLVCEYDEFTIDDEKNRIIKATLKLLMKQDISKERKKEIKNVLMYLDEVSDVDIHSINFNQRFNKNNETYRMLISICYLVIKGQLQSKTEGKTKVMDFFDEQKMHRLYEKFILEYYKKEHSEIKASASQIPWILDDGFDDKLPIMQSDIMLEKDNNILIIDAKYYSHMFQMRFDKHTLHSNNVYQIFTYVKNKEAELKDKNNKVSGMLLYAKTNEQIELDNIYHMSGNEISVKNLDLNCDFEDIKKQLDDISCKLS